MGRKVKVRIERTERLMARTAVGLFNTQDQAQQAIHDLKGIGFADADIGLVMQDRPTESAHTGTGSQSTEGAVAGGILGGTIGALLAATGALVIPGIGPFITGGMLITLIGGATGWLVGGLVGLGIPKEDAGYYEEQVQGGRALVVVRADERIADAQTILARNGGEIERSGERVAILAAPHAPDPAVPRTNLVQRSGQERDRLRSESDDGTIPPTAPREAITTGVDPNVAHTNERQDYLVAMPGMSPDVRTSDTIGPDPKDSAYDRAEKVPASTRCTREQPGEDAANPLPRTLDPEPTRDPDRT
jgi:hypothetical protein